MTARAQRFIWALAVLVLLLVIGRWSVEFVAERWWAATISTAAAAFVTNWTLLGLALDAVAIVFAAGWFAVQALLVARAIASVQVTRRLGNLQLREAVPTRFLLLGAIGSGVLLGLIAGAGAHEWRSPIVLAWQGVHYGVQDPLLGLDLGVYVAQLPVWDLLHRFATLLALLGFVFCAGLYGGIGAISRERGGVAVHADARRHLGALLAVIALVIAFGYRLVPYHVAAATMPSLTAAGAASRMRAADIVSGLALATAILSLVWALRGRNALLLAAWCVLLAGAVGEKLVVPALAEGGPPGAGRLAVARRFDALAWGIRETALPATPAAIPVTTSLWDEAILARVVEGDGGVLEAATPAVLTGVDRLPVAGWLVATPPASNPGALDILAIAEGGTATAGSAAMIPSLDDGVPGRMVWRTVADPRSRPTAPAWRSVATGVNADSPLRRLLLAWARQAPGMLVDGPDRDVDWHLDPVERARVTLPMADWLPADLVLVAGRPTWLVQGLLSIDEFPVATRASWRDQRVAGLAVAFLCTVDPVTGATRFFSDPAADSLGRAWARAIGPVIESADALPADLRQHLTYPAEWLTTQLEVLQGAEWGAGRAQAFGGSIATSTPVWLAGLIPGRQAALNAVEGSRVATVVTAWRADGTPALHLDRRASESTLAADHAELRQLWSRMPTLLHLRDSVAAAGDSTWSRAPRWQPGLDGVAWQPVFAVPRHGTPSLLWIATASGDRLGGGRTAAEAWRNVTEANPSEEPQGPDEATTLDYARRTMLQADSALRRGDMTAFGRAFEELRRTLRRPPH